MESAKAELVKTAHPVETQLAQQPTTPAMAMVASMERLCSNPDVTPEKMQQWLDVQERILDKQAKQEYAADMALAQSEMPVVGRDLHNKQTNSWYASEQSLMAAIQPIYSKHGFGLSFYEGETDKPNFVRVMVDVSHAGGHTVHRHVDLPIDNLGPQGKPNKSLMHGTISTFTYGKSRLTRMVFNIATGQDDDGNAGGGKPPQGPQPGDRARKAQQARQARNNPEQENVPQATPEPAKKPQSKEGAEKREFAHTCNVQAHVFGLIDEGDKLATAEYQSLLAQAQQLAGAETVPEATEWAIRNVTNMVRDEGGIRFIS